MVSWTITEVSQCVVAYCLFGLGFTGIVECPGSLSFRTHVMTPGLEDFFIHCLGPFVQRSASCHRDGPMQIVPPPPPKGQSGTLLLGLAAIVKRR